MGRGGPFYLHSMGVGGACVMLAGISAGLPDLEVYFSAGHVHEARREAEDNFTFSPETQRWTLCRCAVVWFPPQRSPQLTSFVSHQDG